MTKAIGAFRDIRHNKLDALINKIQLNIEDEIELFSPEIHISIAYCDSLFEAGIFSRLEAERVKNALLTILKRSEFDKSYFDNSKAQNIYQFIEEKLLHLIGELGLKLQIGRSFYDRNSTSMRLWLREEISQIYKTLNLMQEAFIDLAESNDQQKFLIQSKVGENQPILFAHWCLAHFETLRCDRERLDEVWRRVNTMPLGANNGIGSTLEFDREELAQKLGFQRITTNSLEAIRNQDYLMEFANVASIIATHQTHLLNELSYYFDLRFLSSELKINLENLNLIKGKLKKVFAYQAELQSNLQSESLKFNKKFNGNNVAVFGCSAVLRNCLEVINFGVNSISLNRDIVNKHLINALPNEKEIFDYLVQRDETIEEAKTNSKKIVSLIKSNKTLVNSNLKDLQMISSKIENDFFSELSLENIITNKSQVGGTSFERVSEALVDAKRTLQYED